MKAYMYQVNIVRSLEDTPQGGIPHTRVYFPKCGVIGYSNIGSVDFFTDDPADITESIQVLAGNGKGKYLGEVEVSNKLRSELIFRGRLRNQADNEFQESGKELIELVEKELIEF